MPSYKPLYQKPKITTKKLKISFFLSRVSWLDQFNMLGSVYAQSGGGSSDGSYPGSWADTTTNTTGTTGTPDSSYDGGYDSGY